MILKRTLNFHHTLETWLLKTSLFMLHRIQFTEAKSSDYTRKNIYVRKMENFLSQLGRRYSEFIHFVLWSKNEMIRKFIEIHANFISRTEIRFLRHDSIAHFEWKWVDEWSHINHPIPCIFRTGFKNWKRSRWKMKCK